MDKKPSTLVIIYLLYIPKICNSLLDLLVLASVVEFTNCLQLIKEYLFFIQIFVEIGQVCILFGDMYVSIYAHYNQSLLICGEDV